MLKFYGKLILALLPLMMFLTIFVVYEPYNYWGFKSEKSGLWTRPLSRVRAYLREPSENIILGDSRMNQLNLETIEEMTGIRYANLSTGGQGTNLSREFYDWAKSKAGVENLVEDASFYMVRPYASNPSAMPTFYIAEHPLLYITTRDYVVEAFELFWKDKFKRPQAHPPADESKGDSAEVEQEGKYRQDLVEYATKNIYPDCENYSIDPTILGHLTYILEDCNKRGVPITMVLPPVHESIWELVIEPLELEPYLEEYREILLQYTDLYDMEWLSDYAKEQDIYADGFHFLLKDGYERFQKALFTGEAEFLKIIPKKSMKS